MSDMPNAVAGAAGPFPGSPSRVPVPRRSGAESARTGPRADGVPVLSDRDRELLRHLAEGRSTSEIAAAMSVTRNTVRTRIRRVRGKLAVPARDRVVDAARDLGVI